MMICLLQISETCSGYWVNGRLTMG